MTIYSLLENAKAVRDGLQGQLVRDVLERHGDEIVEQQKIQLLEGKNSMGEDIHPFYTEDVKPNGWFKSVVPDTAYAANIMAKYGRGMFGLSMDRWGIIFDEKGAGDELIEAIKNLLWQ